MRILNILSGLAVLFTTLAFGHLLQHHLLHHHSVGVSGADLRGPAFFAAMAAAVVIFILSFIGGCLLLRRAR